MAVPAGSCQMLGAVGQGHAAELCDVYRQLKIGAESTP